MMGLLPDVADDLHISIPTAGHLVSAYALGVVIGAPLLAAATARMSAASRPDLPDGAVRRRQRALRLAPDYGWLLPPASSAVCRTAPSSASARSWPPAWSRRSARPAPSR